MSFVDQSIDFYKLSYIFCCLFMLFMRLCLSAQEYAPLLGKILLGVGGSEIGISTNIIKITLQLADCFFSPLRILS